jgi:hypothetical protein
VEERTCSPPVPPNALLQAIEIHGKKRQFCSSTNSISDEVRPARNSFGFSNHNPGDRPISERPGNRGDSNRTKCTMRSSAAVCLDGTTFEELQIVNTKNPHVRPTCRQVTLSAELRWTYSKSPAWPDAGLGRPWCPERG